MKLERSILTYGLMSAAVAGASYATFQPAPKTFNAPMSLTTFESGATASAAEVNGNFAFIDGKATQNAVNIAANAGSIQKNATDLAAVSATATNNSSELAANTATIATNTGNIATNSSAITTMEGRVVKNANDVSTLGQRVDANVTTIRSHDARIGNNKNEIDVLKAQRTVRSINNVRGTTTGNVNLVAGNGLTITPRSGSSDIVIATRPTANFSSSTAPTTSVTSTKAGAYGTTGALDVTANGANGLWVRTARGGNHTGGATGGYFQAINNATTKRQDVTTGVYAVAAEGKVAGQGDTVAFDGRASTASRSSGEIRSESYGVRVRAVARGQAIGVSGESLNGSAGHSSLGIFGKANNGLLNFAVYADGRFAATSTKAFLHPHPKDPSKVVKFTCLEGNEAGTYFRGRGRVQSGSATIEIPEEWQLVTAEAQLTVHLTPIKSLAKIAVWDLSTRRITVRADEDCEFSYIVHGVRRGFEKIAKILPNAAFRPKLIGVPYGTTYTKAYRDLLVENGILNADYTPNLATAQRLGWELRQPTEEEILTAIESEKLWAQSQIDQAAAQAVEKAAVNR